VVVMTSGCPTIFPLVLPYPILVAFPAVDISVGRLGGAVVSAGGGAFDVLNGYVIVSTVVVSTTRSLRGGETGVGGAAGTGGEAVIGTVRVIVLTLPGKP
jgi:cobalamin biosynthesis protein CbiD